MAEEGIETRILGDGAEGSCGFSPRQLADVESDVEIECVRTRSRNLYVLSVRTHLLKCCRHFVGDLVLMCADEHAHPEVIVPECRKVLRLYALIVDEYVVC